MFYVVSLSPNLFAKAFGWLGAACFAAATVGISLHLFRRDPIVVIDETGVLDTRMGIGHISWQDIVGISVEWVWFVRFVAISLRDEDKYLARAPKWRRLGLQSNRPLGYSPFRINLVGLSPGCNAVYRYMQDHARLRAVV
jgi:hypothetical protein